MWRRVGDSLNVELAWRDLECESSEHYKGFIVRTRLESVLNETVKSNTNAHEEEVQRFPRSVYQFFQIPRWTHAAVELWDARCLSGTLSWSLCPLSWSPYLADFLHLREAETASCEGVVTECKVCDALTQVGLNKSPGLDDLPYEVYLRLPHMFVPILMDMFNH